MDAGHSCCTIGIADVMRGGPRTGARVAHPSAQLPPELAGIELFLALKSC